MAEEVVDRLSHNGVLAALDDVSDDVKDDKTEELNLNPEVEDEVVDESEEDNEEEVKEDDEIEEDKEKEAKIEDEEELEYAEVPNRQAILKNYPDLFKKFPGIERAIYREDQYTKIFPSIKEAENARGRLDTFNRVESDLLDGNIKGILDSVKKESPKAFEKISGKILQTLAEVDQNAYFNTLDHVVRHTVKSAFDSGKKMGGEEGEQLQLAAQIINRFIYNTTEVADPKPLLAEEKVNPDEARINERERQFNERQLTTAVKEVTGRAETIITNAINKYIDPHNVMSGYVRTKAVKDVFDSVSNEISSDPRFKAHIDTLWKDAFKNGFSDESKTKIRKAIISKAQTILNGHIRKVRADALKGSGTKRALKKEDVSDRSEERRRTAPSNNGSRSSNEKPRRLGNINDVMKLLE